MSTAGRPTAQQSVERRQLRRRLLLSSPAMLMLVLFLVIPLGIMFAVSIQQSGDYGGVKWGQHSLEAYLNFLWERDLDDSLVFNADYLGIFQRSFWLSLLTTLGCLALGFPTALYLALQPERRRNLLAVPGPPCRSGPTCWCGSYAWILLLRNGGLVDAGLQGIGLTDTGLGAALYRQRGDHRPPLYLPAVHGAADLQQPGKDGLAPGGGGIRPRRQPLESAAPGDRAAGDAGDSRRPASWYSSRPWAATSFRNCSAAVRR
ncbi:ABC transporter permease [Pseudomonas aeruginosa]|nr:ABC transporter permease [Pseudomonas aeruginosa]